MKDGLSRFEFYLFLFLVFLALIPLIRDGGLSRLLWMGMDTSSIDPGVLASARLAMVLLAIVALFKLWAKNK